MKPKQIKFFSPYEPVEKVKPLKAEPAKAYITSGGKFILPLATLKQLGISTESARFKVGVDVNKRVFKGLYLIPDQAIQAPTFELVKIGKYYALVLKGIFQKLGLDFTNTLFEFEIKPVELPGETGFFAKLTSESAREVEGSRSHG